MQKVITLLILVMAIGSEMFEGYGNLAEARVSRCTNLLKKG